MIVKMIIGVLLIGFGFSLIDSVEGIEIKKY